MRSLVMAPATRPRREPVGPGSEHGSITLELAVLAPALLLLVSLVVALGRMQVAHGSIEDASRDAARAASIARSAAAAQLAAQHTAQASLSQQGLQCRQMAVQVNIGGFATPLGTASSVRVAVRCLVDLSDVALPGLPGTKQLDATYTSPIDTYRTRT